jgi:hypothetical protein
MSLLLLNYDMGPATKTFLLLYAPYLKTRESKNAFPGPGNAKRIKGIKNAYLPAETLCHLFFGARISWLVLLKVL